MIQTRKTVVGLAAAILILGAIAIYFFYPNRYISLDVNPGIEMQVNRLDRVVSLVGANEDAKALLAEHQPKTKELNAVVDELIDSMVEEGYLAEDKENDVLITSGDDDKADKTLQKISEQVESSLEEHGLPTAQILTQTIKVDKEIEDNASKHQVSAGKMAVINRLTVEDLSLTAESLAHTRISDLVDVAAENNIPLDELESKIGELKDGMSDADAKHLESLEDAL
ncbi:MAG: hypothetical protein RSG54_10770, partial [Clostridium sp.]